MIEQHKSFYPVSDDTILWQYMSLPKFMSLIKTRKLHFHRIDDFSDKDEGVLSVIDKKGLSFFCENNEWKEFLANERARTFISCWINSPYELALMWETYGKNGVAIQTTAGSLRKAFESQLEFLVRMIEVRYIDKETESSQIAGTPLNMLRFPTTKRKFFEQEKEVRLLFFDEDRKYANQTGVNIDLNINILIEKVLTSPTMPQYIHDLVCMELEEMKMHKKTIKSEL